MKTILHPSLVNDPLGDPGLFVDFLYEKRAFLFDMGDLAALTNAQLLKVSHVFISHTHIDHFIGFDRFLRVVFGREKTIRLYGPKNFINNVEGKLAGFTWNLVERYDESISLLVTEVNEDSKITATFRAIDRFKRTNEFEESFDDGLLFEEPSLKVHCAILQHRVPCLGFSINENFHININKEELLANGWPPGPWLDELKRCVFEEVENDQLISVPVEQNENQSFQKISMGKLKEKLITITRGQKIAYIVDTVYTEENNRKIVALIKGADILFCESPFIAEETERARDRCHLTTEQAGNLARMAGVGQLKIFHFSSRHSHQTERLYQEAEAAFRNQD